MAVLKSYNHTIKQSLSEKATYKELKLQRQNKISKHSSNIFYLFVSVIEKMYGSKIYCFHSWPSSSLYIPRRGSIIAASATIFIIRSKFKIIEKSISQFINYLDKNKCFERSFFKIINFLWMIFWLLWIKFVFHIYQYKSW